MSNYFLFVGEADVQGGKLENTMAEYMDALLARTPVIGKPTYNVPAVDLTCFRIGDAEALEGEYIIEKEVNRWRTEFGAQENAVKTKVTPADADSAKYTTDGDGEKGEQLRDDESTEDVEIFDAEDHIDEGVAADGGLDNETMERRKLKEIGAPDPSQPIVIFPQYPPIFEGIDITNPSEEDQDLMPYIKYFEALNKIHAVDREWESSHKEPLIEIPIKRTHQYWAIIQEMEEYSEKRAAQALEGLDGRTMTEKEEGIKMFEQYFGGLRSLGGRGMYQGTPPWEQNLSEKERRQRQIKAAKLAREKLKQKNLPATLETTPTTAPSPAERFRQATSTDLSSKQTMVMQPKERVVWRFEDVSWVKQRTFRPRKVSYVGMLDKRVQLESGMARYGPFGIGGGTIEGVGGVKHIIERGLDGKLRLEKPPKEVERVRREIVV